MPEPPVVIIGAGLAGLCCALRLQERQIPFRILEAADRPGGRIRTDRLNGFLLDRGFQVLLTAYPEAKRILDYSALELRRFIPGAMVYSDGRLQRVADPLRSPLRALPGAFSSIGTFADKLRVLKLRQRVMRGSLQSVLSNPESTTMEELKELGFSSQMIDRFFRPFLGGIFLEKELITSSRKFEFVFRMFSEGHAALPLNGMQAIPDQLAARLPKGSIDYETRVTAIDGMNLVTSRGESIAASSIVIAVDLPEAMKLLEQSPPSPQSQSAHGTICLYFDAPRSPVKGPWLVLNGEADGLVNNLCVPSDVAPNYAPAGRALVSATVVGNSAASDQTVEQMVRRQLDLWFGSTADWKHLKTYRIPFALPAQPSGTLSPIAKPLHARDRIILCGDHMDIASLNGAMLSGQRAADAIA